MLTPVTPRPVVGPRPAHRVRPVHSRRALRSPWVWGTALATVVALAALIMTGPGGGQTKGSTPPAASAAPRGSLSPPRRPRPGPDRRHRRQAGRPPDPAHLGHAGHRHALAGNGIRGGGVPPGGDVSVSQYVIDPNNRRHAVVNGTVVNHDTQTDDYTITVAVQQGAQTVGSAFVTDDQVAVGADSPWSALGTLSPGPAAT